MIIHRNSNEFITIPWNSHDSLETLMNSMNSYEVLVIPHGRLNGEPGAVMRHAERSVLVGADAGISRLSPTGADRNY